MTKSKTLFATAVIAAVATVGGFVAAPFHGSASAAAGYADAEVVASRIGGAFALVSATVEADPQVRAAVVRAAKGDLPKSLRCVGQTWPHVESGCLITAAGTPAPKVRFITVGSQTGDSETVLLRIPADLVASR